MNTQEYIRHVLRTEIPSENLRGRSQNEMFLRLLHAGLGIVTETGEFVDVLKKYLVYGREIDYLNLKEELGDLLWYIAIAIDALGVSFEQIMEANVRKLRVRYGEHASEYAALRRDIAQELDVLKRTLERGDET
jgi:NTP pyrophosphatase (non-canonical NTP hydrolase)